MFETAQRHGSCVKICTRTWPSKSKSGVEVRLFTVYTVLRISKTNVLRNCFMCQSWIQRRVRKLKSCGGTSFRIQMWVVRWTKWFPMLNVTHRHVFVSQKVCRHSSCSVRTWAWTRLVGDTFVWKRGSRNKTWEIRWQVTYRHVLLCENLHTHTTL